MPTLALQAERLVALGLHDRAGIPAEDLLACAGRVDDEPGLLVVHPECLGASALAPMVEVGGRRVFVVYDMEDDLDAYTAIDGARPAASAVYVIRGLDRGDDMRNWSPDEALPAMRAAGRTPLTVSEGLHWILQQPTFLERNSCFMTIGSRRLKTGGKRDARTPAFWISNGTGRDGVQRRDAPKVGWCWAGNRHTWLGFASAASRSPLDVPSRL